MHPAGLPTRLCTVLAAGAGWRRLLPSRGRWAVGLIFGLAVGAAAAPGAEPGANTEATLKATYLYQLINETTWPASAFESESAALEIAVVGDRGFFAVVSAVLQGEKSHNRPLRVRHITEPTEIGSAVVLFITASERKRQRDLISSLQNAKVLVVGDGDRFCDDGGMVGLTRVKDRIKLQVHANNLKAAGLRLSSQVLKLAEVIGNPDG